MEPRLRAMSLSGEECGSASRDAAPCASDSECSVQLDSADALAALLADRALSGRAVVEKAREFVAAIDADRLQAVLSCSRWCGLDARALAVRVALHAIAFAASGDARHAVLAAAQADAVCARWPDARGAPCIDAVRHWIRAQEAAVFASAVAALPVATGSLLLLVALGDKSSFPVNSAAEYLIPKAGVFPLEQPVVRALAGTAITKRLLPLGAVTPALQRQMLRDSAAGVSLARALLCECTAGHGALFDGGPESLGAQLVKALGSDSDAVRGAAVASLAHSHTAADAALLANALEAGHAGRSPRGRRAAAEALYGACTRGARSETLSAAAAAASRLAAKETDEDALALLFAVQAYCGSAPASLVSSCAALSRSTARAAAQCGTVAGCVQAGVVVPRIEVPKDATQTEQMLSVLCDPAGCAKSAHLPLLLRDSALAELVSRCAVLRPGSLMAGVVCADGLPRATRTRLWSLVVCAGGGRVCADAAAFLAKMPAVPSAAVQALADALGACPVSDHRALVLLRAAVRTRVDALRVLPLWRHAYMAAFWRRTCAFAPVEDGEAAYGVLLDALPGDSVDRASLSAAYALVPAMADCLAADLSHALEPQPGDAKPRAPRAGPARVVLGPELVRVGVHAMALEDAASRSVLETHAAGLADRAAALVLDAERPADVARVLLALGAAASAPVGAVAGGRLAAALLHSVPEAASLAGEQWRLADWTRSLAGVLGAAASAGEATRGLVAALALPAARRAQPSVHLFCAARDYASASGDARFVSVAVRQAAALDSAAGGEAGAAEALNGCVIDDAAREAVERALAGGAVAQTRLALRLVPRAALGETGKRLVWLLAHDAAYADVCAPLSPACREPMAPAALLALVVAEETPERIASAASSAYPRDLSALVRAADEAYRRLCAASVPAVASVRGGRRDLTLSGRTRLADLLASVCSADITTPANTPPAALAAAVRLAAVAGQADASPVVRAAMARAADAGVRAAVACGDDAGVRGVCAVLDDAFSAAMSLDAADADGANVTPDGRAVKAGEALGTIGARMDKHNLARSREAPVSSTASQMPITRDGDADTPPADSSTSNRTRTETVVVLMAAAAGGFAPGDARRDALLGRLVRMLRDARTEETRCAAGAALAELYAQMRAAAARDAETYLAEGIEGARDAPALWAAHGLGAAVAGGGLRVYASVRVHERLVAILANRSSAPGQVLGALHGVRVLAAMLGRRLEPYASPGLVDALLIHAAGESRADVCASVRGAGDALLATLGAHGARLALPCLLRALGASEKPWRTRACAAEWLCVLLTSNPKALCPALGTLVPALVDALGDGHAGVQRAARAALTAAAGAVRSPEVRALAPLLVDALADAPRAADGALDALARTAFAHVVDASSAALLQPVLLRALSPGVCAETKRRAALVVANLATDVMDARATALFDAAVPRLLACLSDPVAEVRANAGRVLGVLVGAVSRASAENGAAMASRLSDALLSVLSGATASSVERAGAAAALAEVLCAQGASAAVAHVSRHAAPGLGDAAPGAREGHLHVLGALASVFGRDEDALAEVYAGGLRGVLPGALGLLADGADGVRQAAERACTSIVARVARIDHVAMLDVLVEASADSRWRVRLGALSLLRDFLSALIGQPDASSPPNAEGAEASLPGTDDLRSIGLDEGRIAALGARVLLLRFDPSAAAVRAHALALWRGLAPHPVRAVLAILDALVADMVACVSAQAEMVAAALGDVLSKLGERVALPLVQALAARMAHHPAEAAGALSVLVLVAQALASSGQSSGAPPGAVAALVTAVSAGVEDGRADVRSAAVRLFGALASWRPSVCSDVVLPLLSDLLVRDAGDGTLGEKAGTHPSDDSTGTRSANGEGTVGESGVAHPSEDSTRVQSTDGIVDSPSADDDEWTEDPVALDALAALVRARPGGVAAIAVAEALRALAAGETAPALAVLRCVFCAATPDEEGAPEDVQRLAVPAMRAICDAACGNSEPTTATFNGGSESLAQEDSLFDDALLAAVAALGEDSAYHVSLAQLLEALHAEAREALAFRVVRVACAAPAGSPRRFVDVWPARLVEGAFSRGDACASSALAALSARAAAVGDGRLLCGPLTLSLQRVSASGDAGHSAAAGPAVAAIVREIIVPALSDDAESAASLLCALLRAAPGPWPAPALTALVGALIRTAAAGRHAAASALAAVFRGLAAVVAAHAGALKAFHPQLQRILANALALDAVRGQAASALGALVPRLARPEALLAEWAMLFVAESGAAAEHKLAVLDVLRAAPSVAADPRAADLLNAIRGDTDPRIAAAARLLES